jgi:hypothetical protein
VVWPSQARLTGRESTSGSLRAIVRSSRLPCLQVRRCVWRGSLQALLSQADRELGRLDGSVLTLPNPDLFVFMYAAANSLVSRMADIGILSEMTGYARNRRFRYEPYVRLFTDETMEAGDELAKND